MAEALTIENFGTLMMLIFLQAVLGFDNLLYISIESKRVAADKQQSVRRLGIGLAIILRIVLLFVVIKAIESFQSPLFGIHLEGIFEGGFNLHALIVLAGGVFILYTATKEIMHMLSIEELHGEAEKAPRSVNSAIFWIVLMNLVFSFDSILSAIALTDVFWVMAVAIILSGILMMALADRVSDFLQKNRMYEVLGLFILFLVGVMLISEGGHLAHMSLGGHEVHPMAKSTFYLVIIILVVVDVAQGRYQKKLDLERKRGEPPVKSA
jgi:predicted tellurium resistance membrane protein TerC